MVAWLVPAMVFGFVDMLGVVTGLTDVLVLEFGEYLTLVLLRY